MTARQRTMSGGYDVSFSQEEAGAIKQMLNQTVAKLEVLETCVNSLSQSLDTLGQTMNQKINTLTQIILQRAFQTQTVTSQNYAKGSTRRLDTDTLCTMNVSKEDRSTERKYVRNPLSVSKVHNAIPVQDKVSVTGVYGIDENSFKLFGCGETDNGADVQTEDSNHERRKHEQGTEVTCIERVPVQRFTVDQIIEHAIVQVKSCKDEKCVGMDTVLCIDTSSKMTGEPIRTTKRFVHDFLEKLEVIATRHQLKENVALVTFGDRNEIVHHLTNEYGQLKETIDSLTTSGPSPLELGLRLSALEIEIRGALHSMSQLEIQPRIIVLTNGHASRTACVNSPDLANTEEDGALAEISEFARMHRNSVCVEFVGCEEPAMDALIPFAHHFNREPCTEADIGSLSKSQLYHSVASIVIDQYNGVMDTNRLEDIESNLLPAAVQHLELGLTDEDKPHILSIIHKYIPEQKTTSADDRCVAQQFAEAPRDIADRVVVNKTIPRASPCQVKSSQKETSTLVKRPGTAFPRPDEEEPESIYLTKRTIRNDTLWKIKAREVAQMGAQLDHLGGIHTVICLDVSSSMKQGGASEQMATFFMEYIQGMMQNQVSHGITKENVALVTFGRQTEVLHMLTNDFSKMTESFDKVELGGPSPMYGGLLLSLATATADGSFGGVNGITMYPKIILVTDGKPTEATLIDGPDDFILEDQEQIRNKIMEPIQQMRRKKIKVFCVPVGDADTTLLEHISSVTKAKMLHYTQGAFFSRTIFHTMCAGGIGVDTVGTPFEDLLENIAKNMFEEFTHDDIAAVREIAQLKLKGGEESDGNDESDDEYSEIEGSGLPGLGSRVKRGPDWRWDSQDDEGPGTVIGHHDDGVLAVEWDSNQYKNIYGYSAEKGYHVILEGGPRALSDGESIAVGCIVQRGPDWNRGTDDGGAGNEGVVLKVKAKGKVLVKWKNGKKGTYRFGAKSKYDVIVCPTPPQIGPFQAPTSFLPQIDLSGFPPSVLATVVVRGDDSDGTTTQNVCDQLPKASSFEDPSSYKTVVWRFLEDGQWKCYSTPQCLLIEEAYIKKPASTHLAVYGTTQHRILFSKMKSRIIHGSHTTEFQIQRSEVAREEMDIFVSDPSDIKES